MATLTAANAAFLPLAFLALLISLLIANSRFPHPITPSPLSSPSPPSLSTPPWSPSTAANIPLSPTNAHILSRRRGLSNPETTFFADPSDCTTLHATDARGRIWSLSPPDKPTVVAHVGGALLGAAAAADGGLYLADATKGLFYLPPGWTRGDRSETTPLLVASMAPADYAASASASALDAAEIRYCNDVAVDDATGLVYFSDSSRIAPTVSSQRHGDTFRSYGDSHLSGDATGRLLVYDPATAGAHVLVTGIPFANGVTVSSDGASVLVVSTTSYSVRAFPALAKGTPFPDPVKADELALFSGGRLPGMPDGIWASKEDGSVFVALAAPILPILKLADGTALPYFYFMSCRPVSMSRTSRSIYPPKRESDTKAVYFIFFALRFFFFHVAAGNTLLRRLLVSTPYSLRPTPDVLYAAVAHFAANGTLVRMYHDSVSKRLGFISSIQQCGKSLYGGVLSRDFVVKIDMHGS